jgi:5'-methylthioadenosine phosphorylase
MTVYPEVALAREVEMCYSSLAMVTDYDVWADKPVSTSDILTTMSKNVEHFKKLVVEVIPRIPSVRKCLCAETLQDACIN